MTASHNSELETHDANRGRRNVGDVERWLSVASGAALTVAGARRRGVDGTLLALLGGALVHRGVTGNCRVYGALGLDSADAAINRSLSQQHGDSAVLDAAHAIRVERSITIMRPVEELFRFWRDFENLPRVMGHLEAVTVKSLTRSHWTAKGPAGSKIEWEAEIINERPNELIAWKSIEGALVPNAGSVHFTPAPGDRGTEVRVVLEYAPPAGRLGAQVARLLGEEPGIQVREDLWRLKQLMETGEITVSPRSAGRGGEPRAQGAEA